MTHSDWISRKELMALTSWADRTVRHKEAARELKTRLTSKRGANGQPIKEYDASCLPADAQLKRLEQKMAANALVSVKQSMTAVATLPEPRSERVILALDALDDEARKQAQQRLKIIAPLIDFVNKTNG